MVDLVNFLEPIELVVARAAGVSTVFVVLMMFHGS
jgi:hypothetical protein